MKDLTKLTDQELWDEHNRYAYGESNLTQRYRDRIKSELHRRHAPLVVPPEIWEEWEQTRLRSRPPIAFRSKP